MSVSAGETPLLNVFKDGVVLVLRSEASGKNLRILQNGDVEGLGGNGELAQFKVHVRRPGVVALQNVNNSDHWLRAKDEELDGEGRGGPFTEFKLEEHNDRVVFESVKYPGQHVGIRENGEKKKPNHTGTMKHGQFYPKVIHERKETITAGTDHFEKLLAHGNVVVLESVASGKTLRVFDDGKLEGLGGNGALAQFIVHVRGEHKISLQCVKHPERWLAIKNEELRSSGSGGKYTELKIDSNDGHLVLESVMFPGQHIGVRENGEVKKPNHTGRLKHGQFKVKVIKEQPEYHRAGTSLTERTLHHGNSVVLFSKSSRKTLRIHPDGRLEGIGGEGALAQFTVHVRCPGVVALQNVKSPHLWLKIKSHELSTGGGGRKCELKVKDKGEFLVFESVAHPGHHVGVLPNGDVKPPGNTKEGDHGQFSPRVKKDSPYSRT